MRTSEQIQAEIEEKFGFFPPFFSPALKNPMVLENLWQQTISAYVGNPLSPLFKEKLSAYLSRYCIVPYCMICHSCSLRPLGVKAVEVLKLLESCPAQETDILQHLKMLAAYPGGLRDTSSWDEAVEESLLKCSVSIFLQQEGAEYVRSHLHRILGSVNYQHLVAFLAYIKTCHLWIEAHPKVAYSYTTDQRAVENLAPLLDEAPGLADFFQNYSSKVKREQEKFSYRLRKEKLLYKQKQVMEMIATGAELKDVLNVLARNIETQCEEALCSILLLDSDTGTLRHGAAPSLSESYNKAIDGLTIGPKVCSCGTAAYFGKPIIVSDIASNPLWGDFRNLAISHGLLACWSRPIFSSRGQVLGTFAMYYRQPKSPDRLDRQLLKAAVHLAGIAIERQQAEKTLQDWERHFHTIIDLFQPATNHLSRWAALLFQFFFK